MSDIINATNFDDNIQQQSFITADALSGQPQINIQQTISFEVNKFVLLGNIGSERAELLQVQSISDLVVTFKTNLTFKHQKNEPIYLLLADQVKFYSASNPSDGSMPENTAYSLVSGPVTIDYDQFSTPFTSAVDGSQYWFKFTRYNSYTEMETDLADSIAYRGGGYGRYVSVKQVLSEAAINQPNVANEAEITDRINAAEDEIKGRLVSAGYLIPLQTTKGVFYNPPIVTQIARKLAAGLYLTQNFGITKPSSSADGKAKIDEARTLLAEIQLNDLVLTDYNGQMLQKPVLLDGGVDDNTYTTDPDGNSNTGPIITMSKVF